MAFARIVWGGNSLRREECPPARRPGALEVKKPPVKPRAKYETWEPVAKTSMRRWANQWLSAAAGRAMVVVELLKAHGGGERGIGGATLG